MIEIYEVENEDYKKDLVEVTRCKDCARSEGMEASRYVYCRLQGGCVDKDGFCYRAKKRGTP